MHYKDNPFYILKCSPEDDKNKIHEQAELLGFDIDENLCRKAESILLNPKKRLEAEVSWFMGVKREKVDYYLSLIENNPTKCIEELNKIDNKNDINADDYIDNFSKANLLCFALENVKDSDILKLNGEPFENLCLYENYAMTEETNFYITETRNKAGISNNFPEEELEEQIDKQKEYFKKVAYEYLNKIESDKLVNILTEIIKIRTCNGEDECEYDLLEYLINKYEEDVADFFDKQESYIDKIITDIISNLKSKVDKNFIDKGFNNLEKYLFQWKKIAKPIQIYKRSCGLDDDRSIKLYNKIRKLCLTLNNDYGYYEFALRLTRTCANIFIHLNSAQELIKEDLEVLNKIETDIKEQDKRIKKEEEKKWNYYCQFNYKCYVCSVIMDKESITLSKKISSFFSMDIEDIFLSVFNIFNSHKNNSIHFYKDIKKIRCGLYIKETEYVSYIRRTPIYKIQFVNKNDETITIQMEKTNSFLLLVNSYFSEIVNRLLLGPGTQIMNNYLKRLQKEEIITIGIANITDYGIELKKHLIFSKFFVWKDIEKNVSDGNLILKSKDDYSVSLSLLKVWDAVVIEMMLNIFWNKFRGKETRLSAILSILQ